MDSPELLAPAGNWDCVRAAVANGADAVYFGLPRFNARLRADNFREEEVPEVVRFCHERGVRTYVTFNTLVFTDELREAEQYLRLLNRAGVDALIVQDAGLATLARAVVPEMELHASTQMTITSPEGIRFARDLGIQRVVLARELSLREIRKFSAAENGGVPLLPLEVFVHGALCVAYSGQCLTSESLGQRSANRGECAQACRMPYELVVDGALRDLGDRRYLLSPQDLAAVREIPGLLALGVVSFKIEGRLKSPEYVAAVTQVYRKAIDAALEARPYAPSKEDQYQLEMTFSRGFHTGWLHGVNHQELVKARFGKKRGPFAGTVERVGRDFVEFTPQVALKPGDGIVFDTGGDTNAEQGGRVFEVRGRRFLFKYGHIDFRKIKPGDKIWKTDDPVLEAELKKSFGGTIPPRRKERMDLIVTGATGAPLVLTGSCGSSKESISSSMPLQEARNSPLSTATLTQQLGRFGGTRYELGDFRNELQGQVILPLGELNRMRRELVYRFDQNTSTPRADTKFTVETLLAQNARSTPPESKAPAIRVLCRSLEQLCAVLETPAPVVYADFEDIRRYKEAVAIVRTHSNARILLATPRIQKAGEEGFFKLIQSYEPDGLLIRNLGALEFYAGSGLEKIGDFSLNIANPITASVFHKRGLDRLTISYDLNASQVLDLLRDAPPEWFELTIHQHMPMFHMEHCVFAAFLSKGTDHTNCGRPCETHRVHLRDRVGMEHPLRADVGCRNTLFNAVPQTGAGFFDELLAAGLRAFRVELLEEDAKETRKIVAAYSDLIAGRNDGTKLWQTLRAQSQLGVTRGTYAGK